MWKESVKLILIPQQVWIVYWKYFISKYFKIQEAINTPDKFSFHEVTEDEAQQEILRLDGIKAALVGDIPAGMLKCTIDIHASILTKIINSSSRNGFFQMAWKLQKLVKYLKKMTT